MNQGTQHKVTAGALLVALGIIFGDIGTSPLYVLKAIVGHDEQGVANVIDKGVILGGLSCIFWTLTLQTTVKYVILTLRADNKGEGGIFALYALVKKLKTRWLLFAAVIGGGALLADGFITPAISISSAVEGLQVINPEIKTIPIVIAILVVLFTIQQFGTRFIGKFFGPAMFVWFAMLAVMGLMALSDNPGVLTALNPYYAYELLSRHPEAMVILGAVFLCTTGAEALYSDLGHCGRANIRISWIFVKLTLIINYFGQGAWLIAQDGQQLTKNPFYGIMPEGFLTTGIIIATVATIVASQAMISGSFTLINEAMRLNLWPKIRVKFPTELKGQLYIPSINWLLMAGCVFIVLWFKESKYMEGAYGLAIILTMLMSTHLLVAYMILKRYNRLFILIFYIVYATIEISFLVANAHKFMHGGYVSLIFAFGLSAVMLIWYFAHLIRSRYVECVRLSDHLHLLEDLSGDLTIPKYATHLVYLTSAANPKEIEANIIYSISMMQPKRADIYWFVHIEVTDEPYGMEYKVSEFIHDDVIRIDFRLGFREEPLVNLMFRKVVEDMVLNKEVDVTSRYKSLNKNNVIGDFRFIIIEKVVSYENDFKIYEKVVLDLYAVLKLASLSREKEFGIDASSVAIETVPLVVSSTKNLDLRRIE